MNAPAPRAPRTDGRIELRLRQLDQLFDSFDPAPFHEKDLDRDAEEFIVSWAREYAVDAPLVFRLHLPEDRRDADAERIVTDAVHNYFAYRADLARLEPAEFAALMRKDYEKYGKLVRDVGVKLE